MDRDGPALLARVAAADDAIVARTQALADAAWDAHGVTAGDICSALALVGYGLYVDPSDAMGAAVLTALVLVMLAMFCLESAAQRRGRHAWLNRVARLSRATGPVQRIVHLALVCILAGAALTGAVPPGCVIPAMTTVGLVYARTIMVRPRKPPERRAPARAARGMGGPGLLPGR